MLKEVPKLVTKAIFAVTFTKLLGPLGIPVGLMLSENLMESLGEHSEEFFKKLGEETGLKLAESQSEIFGFLKGNSDLANESAPDYTLARLLAKVWEKRLNELIKSKNFDDIEFKKQTKLLTKWRGKFKEAQDETKLYTFYEIFPKETASDFAIEQKSFVTITNQTEAEDQLWQSLKNTLDNWTTKEEKITFEKIENDVRKALTEDLQSELVIQLKNNETFRASFNTTFEFFAVEQFKKQGKTAEETNKIVKQLLEIIQNQPKPATLPKYLAFNSFPSHTNYFTGRGEVIDGIREELENHHKATLHGISGLGKTSAALEYAKRFEDFYEHIIFLRATDGNELSEFAKIAEIVDESAKSLEKDADKAVKFKNWLAENDGWLLLIDNVDTPSNVKPLLPNNLRGHCLSTGNSDEITILGNEVEIKPMKSENGELLLYRRAKTLSGIDDEEIKQLLQNETEAEQNAVRNIVKEFDGLPLALNLAGAYIHTFKKSFIQYENLYRTSAHKLLDIQDVNDQYQNYSVALAFSLAFEEIAKPENESSEAKQIAETAVLFLKTASFLNPEAIPLEIFTDIFAEQSESAKESSQDELFLDQVFAKIAQFDLFEKDNDKDTVNIHRLVQKVINNKIEADEKQLICSQILEVLRNLMPKYDYFNKETCERYFRQTETALENADKLPLENENSDLLYYRLGYFQYLSGNYQLAEKFYYLSWKISENVYGKEHEQTATSLNELAVIYNLLGRYDEAIKCRRICIEINRKIFGNVHPRIATDLNNLANVYKSQGRYDEAIEKYEEALAIDEKTIGKEHPDYAIDLNNLAIVYRSQGRYDEAIEKYEEALAIDEKTIGKEHPEHARHLSNLASVYLSQGKFEIVENLYSQVKQIREKVLGKEHPDTALTYWWIAELKVKQNKFEDAISFYKDAVQIFVKFLGEDHHLTKGAKGNLENCRKEMENSQ